MRLGSSILVLSPSLQGGSWRWIEEVFGECDGLVRRRSVVLAYGGRRLKSRVFQSVLRLPFIPYERVGLALSQHTLMLAAYNAPLALMSLVALWIMRPRVVIANGILLAAIAIPYAWISGAKLYLAYHGYAGHYSRRVRKIVGGALQRVDYGIVNSVGSERDLSSLLESARILRVEHWADDLYFTEQDQRRRVPGPLTVLYVGRLDEEKIAFLLDVIRACKGSAVRFLVAGSGPLAADVERLGRTHAVLSYGYISDKRRLAELYACADIVWAVADDTYLAKPGVEALATGTPVIVPDVPAVRARAVAGVRVPHDLLPSSVAWIIDGENVTAAQALLVRLADDLPDMWEACRAYAREHYSRENVMPVVNLVEAALRC